MGAWQSHGDRTSGRCEPSDQAEPPLIEPLGDAGEVIALVEGVLQLQFRRPPRPVPGERARAVRAAAVHALHVEYLGAERVPHRHEHHPVVRQLRHRRQPDKLRENVSICYTITHCHCHG